MVNVAMFLLLVVMDVMRRGMQLTKLLHQMVGMWMSARSKAQEDKAKTDMMPAFLVTSDVGWLLPSQRCAAVPVHHPSLCKKAFKAKVRADTPCHNALNIPLDMGMPLPMLLARPASAHLCPCAGVQANRAYTWLASCWLSAVRFALVLLFLGSPGPWEEDAGLVSETIATIALAETISEVHRFTVSMTV
jgi:hypothetical protein